MKLIIAGSRKLTLSNHFLLEALEMCSPIDWNSAEKLEVVSGGAMGIDWCGERLAKSFGVGTKIFTPKYRFPNDKEAPILRNAEMAEYGDALFLVWDGESRGSANMREQMLKRKKPVYECILRGKHGKNG